MANLQLSNSSRKCLAPKELQLSANFVETLFFGILLPPVILFGLVGNLLTLFVLLAHRTKTRSNTLLSVLASLDGLFFMLMLPNSLAHFNAISESLAFRHFYFSIKIHLLAMINHCSAAAIWIMLAICLDRFIGVSRPLSVRKRPFRWISTCQFIILVLVGTFILTFYIHISFHCIQLYFCNQTQLYSNCERIDKWLDKSTNSSSSFPPNSTTLPPSPSLLLLFLRFSPHFHALFVIFLPTLFIIGSNVALLFALHKRDHYLALDRTNSSETSQSGSTRLSQSSAQNARIEHRLAIVTCFTLTQTPSAIVELFGKPADPKDQDSMILRSSTFFLVAFGKSINFVLFCLSSASFRARLILMVKNKLGKKRWSFSNQRSTF